MVCSGKLATAGDLFPQWLLAIAEQPAPLGFKSAPSAGEQATERHPERFVHVVGAWHVCIAKAYMGLSGDFQLMVRAFQWHRILSMSAKVA